MTDRYLALVNTPVGQLIAKNVGIPNPPVLERWRDGAPLVDGTVLVGAAEGGRLEKYVGDLLATHDVAVDGAAEDGKRYKGIVFDASGIRTPDQLVRLQEFFTPVLRSLARCGRVVVLGTPVENAESDGEAIAQRALEGITRSLGKEVGRGATVQLVYVAPGAEDAAASTLEFLLSPKSAYVSGQVIRIGTLAKNAPEPVDVRRPLEGKVALVTGASRGLGEAMARTLHRDGATIVGLDVAPLASDLKKLIDELGGTSITLDITAADAPKRIARHLDEAHGGVDIVVHNAGITRDKRLRNMKSENWQAVIDVNVGAPQRITAELLDQQLIRPNGRVIGVSSIAGIAGNNGQTNYAASKAGVIGFVQELAARVADTGITVNAIAPGFIETAMVKTIPMAIREAGRRMNSMSQGGRPIDVAETVAWYANPGSSSVSGNVVRVCGQSLLGA
ncbi:3-oxoacyl-ACP reductase [Solicola gregarius]|uniref:3-oxoacyl-ACP reductase n=1 Tax=Solicola gregarius TaxID=2908642 RepID=A0AA46YKU7_9ACTN|nr:3-oxoacyl-ACP reductase [Solicola gregarius]UYM04871.1 3-oxoacyl-ACP reductase [Solicola gregarius]